MFASAAEVGCHIIRADGWRVTMHVEVRRGPLQGPDCECQGPTNRMSAAIFSGSPHSTRGTTSDRTDRQVTSEQPIKRPVRDAPRDNEWAMRSAVDQRDWSDSLQTAGGCVELHHPLDLSGMGFDDGARWPQVPAHKFWQRVEQTVRAARTSRPLSMTWFLLRPEPGAHPLLGDDPSGCWRGWSFPGMEPDGGPCR
jgi:hypothetical protein